MKYLDIMRGLQLIAEICDNNEINIDGADVRLVSFQDGVNGPIRERVILTRGIAGADISISFTPNEDIKEEEPENEGRCEKYFTPEQVRKMSAREVSRNLSAIMRSMHEWGIR